MPAATTMSAISAFSVSRRRARSSTRSRSAAPATRTARIGEITGTGFAPEEIVDAVETIVDRYLEIRTDKEENFLAAYRRVGAAPFKEALYSEAANAA